MTSRLGLVRAWGQAQAPDGMQGPFNFVEASPPVADAETGAAGGGDADAVQNAADENRENKRKEGAGKHHEQGEACNGASAEEKEEPPPLSKDQALLIFSLRSKQTCGKDEVHEAAAGRSAVVSGLLDVPASIVRALWTRQIMVDVTEPFWTERERLMYACEKFKSEGGASSAAGTFRFAFRLSPPPCSPTRLATRTVLFFRP